jgi:hypothetical protein
MLPTAKPSATLVTVRRKTIPARTVSVARRPVRTLSNATKVAPKHALTGSSDSALDNRYVWSPH